MKTAFKGAIAIALLAALAGGANAQKAKPKTMVCPYCKMTMTTKKSKATPVAVKIKGTTYYCCASCHPAKKK
jgi:uncharacterized protein with PIN domain